MKLKRIISKAKEVVPVSLPREIPALEGSVIPENPFTDVATNVVYRWRLSAKVYNPKMFGDGGQTPIPKHVTHTLMGERGRTAQEAWSRFVIGICRGSSWLRTEYTSNFIFVSAEKHSVTTEPYALGEPQLPPVFQFVKSTTGPIDPKCLEFSKYPKSRPIVARPLPKK